MTGAATTLGAAPMLAAVLTVSSSRTRDDDASGDALEESCRAAGLEVVRELSGRRPRLRSSRSSSALRTTSTCGSSSRRAAPA